MFELIKQIMKLIQILLITLLFISGTLQAQIPPKAETIVINGDSLTKGKIVASLVSNGFNINSVSDYVIKSEKKRIKSMDFDISVSIVENTYYFSINWTSVIPLIMNGASIPYMGKCAYKGREKGTYKVGFNQLINVVENLGYPFTYR